MENKKELNLKSKIVLITGATDGIGKQTALELAQMGAQVIVHGRSEERCLKTVKDIRSRLPQAKLDWVCADLSSLEQVRGMASAVNTRFARLDVLINNAGVFEAQRRLSADGYEMTFAVNHLAHFLLTGLLLEKIKQCAPARIINVSSMAHAAKMDFDNLQGEKDYSGYQAYALSKLANILFTFELAEGLLNSGVTVNCLHPGVIRTKLLHAGWGMGGASLSEGAQTPVYLASAPEVADVTGKYFVNRRVALPAAVAQDAATRRRLWQISEALCTFKR